jgi:hypothetical protein
MSGKLIERSVITPCPNRRTWDTRFSLMRIPISLLLFDFALEYHRLVMPAGAENPIPAGLENGNTSGEFDCLQELNPIASNIC